MTAIEIRIKELRWKNESYFTKLFSDKATYKPAEVNAAAKARTYNRGATSVKLFAVFIVAIFMLAIYIPDGKVDSESFYSLLLLGMLLYSQSYSSALRAARFEEIANLQAISTRQ